MIRNILEQHKKERDYLLSRQYIPRIDQEKAGKLLESPLIKIITGPRRAGKSVFSLLMLKNADFSYVNFDDEQILKSYTSDQLIEALHQVYTGFKYIFFDEIQTLPDWELLVNKLYRRGYNILLTGSNARLLSREIGTALTGRYIPIEIFPFSFTEYLKAKGLSISPDNLTTPEETGTLMAVLEQYMVDGGFPEYSINVGLDINYLSTLFDSVLLKDIIKRFKVRYAQQIYDLSNYLISNYTNEYTFNRLKDALKFNSVATVQKFMNYLAEPYIFFSLPRFSYKLTLQQKAPKKLYIVDNGFIKARSFQFSPDRGKLLENMVFVEMLRRSYRPGLELFYYKTKNNKEVDFVCRKGNMIEMLVQVCFDTSNLKILDREITALNTANVELHSGKLVIITWQHDEKIKYNTHEVELIPVWKWLLKPNI